MLSIVLYHMWYLSVKNMANYQSQLFPKSAANSSKYFRSTSSNPAGSVQSISMIATVCPYVSCQHFPQINETHLSANHNRHHNLRPAFGIARDMSRKAQHIIHDKRLPLQGRSTAHALPEDYQLASRFTLERPEKKFPRRGGCRLHSGRAGWIGRDR